MNKLLRQSEYIINKRFDESDENYGLLVIGCYALLSKFGELYSPIVEKVMLNTDFYIGKKPLSLLLEEGGIEAEDAFRGDEYYDNELTVTAISSPGVYLSISEVGTILFERETPAIFCTTIDEDATTVLNAFVHEASHLVKSTVNVVYSDSPTHFLIRNGLNVFGYSFEKGSSFEPSDNSMLDEVINVLQTSDMMKAVKELNGCPMKKEVEDFYKELDLDRIDLLYGYDELTSFVLPLWSNDYFRSSIEDNIVIGKIDRIRNDFDSIMGHNSFHYYSTYLDYIDGNYDDEKLIGNMKEWYDRMNRTYAMRTRVLQMANRNKK
ncbi:MAG: hypothetical protein IJA30_05050 [Bacilli bacterium]|nr:hypothetical protein [Bacilli bacterium]